MRAILQTNIDLLLQLSILCILTISMFYKGKADKVKKHGLLLGLATILEAATFFAYMGPIFFNNFMFFFISFTPIVITFLAHALTGSITLILAVGLLVSWVRRFSNIGPCYKKKKIMYVITIFWVASIVLGIMAYVLSYIL